MGTIVSGVISVVQPLAVPTRAEWGFSGVKGADPNHYLDWAVANGWQAPDRFLCWADQQTSYTKMEGLFAPTGSLGKNLTLWLGTPAKVTVSMAMCLKSTYGDSLAIANGGANDVHWQNIADKIIALGGGGVTIRLGWEYNGSWEPWHAKVGGVQSPNWVPLWQRIHDIMMSRPGAAFKWDWCPSMSGSQFSGAQLENTYPGDAYVDYIGMDCYNQIGPLEAWIPAGSQGTLPNETDAPSKHWDFWLNKNNGVNLTWLAGFAAKHGKLLSMAEWGQNSNQTWKNGTRNDDGYYVAQMANFIKTHNFGYQLYFTSPAPNFAGGFDFSVLQNSIAAWQTAFGITGPGATWISPKVATASTLETGDIVQICAWGGTEPGYAYTYTLDGSQPAGVAIDVDTGRLSIGSALAAGVYAFNVIATARESLVARTFGFNLTILTAIRSGTPTTSQILHKTYDPASGTWGTPTGNDWTAVFNAMHTAILSDQTSANAVYDEAMRVDIPLQRGTTYQYTNNAWCDGIQYLTLHDAGSGALPILQCTSVSSQFSQGPLNMGGGGGTGPGSMGHTGSIKTNCATIATVAEGSTTLTLLNSGDSSKIKLNRWHLVCGSTQQVGGGTPNEGFIDYVKVLSVSGTTVTIDRPLRHGYDQTWWEDSTDDSSLGVARLCPYDVGGTGGLFTSDRRITIRGLIQNMNMLANPNVGTAGQNNVVYMAGSVDFTYKGCTIPFSQVTMSKHVQFVDCTTTYAWAPDKQMETLFYLNQTANGQVISGASGADYVLFRGGHVGAVQVTPRQFRAMGTFFDDTGDGSFPGGAGTYGAPITYGTTGYMGYYDYGSAGACTFTHGGGGSVWAKAFVRSTDAATLTLGTDASFSANQLQIPHSFTNFAKWLTWSVAGAILFTGSGPPFTSNWGYISSVSSDGLGVSGNLYLNVVWVNGVQPSSGAIYLSHRHRLFFAPGNILNTGTNWASPGYDKETSAPFGTNWDFPIANFADAACYITQSSSDMGTGTTVAGPTFANATCRITQSSSGKGTGSTAGGGSGQFTLTMVSVTGTVAGSQQGQGGGPPNP